MSSVLMPFTTQTSGINIGNNDIFRIRDIDASVKMLNVDDGMFYKILSMLPSEEPATQPKYEWAEDDIPGNTAVVGNAYSSTSVTVDDAMPLIAKDPLSANAKERDATLLGKTFPARTRKLGRIDSETEGGL